MISFTVYGRPIPQGSMKAFAQKTTGRIVTTSDNPRTKPWKQEVAATALSERITKFDRHVPVKIELHFYFTKPKSVTKRLGMTVKPDIDKLTRSILDAITGIVIEDDAQVVEIRARKHYTPNAERMTVAIEEAVQIVGASV